MNAGWRAARGVSRRRTSTRNGRRGNRCSAIYIPDAEPRLIPEGALIHQSAIDKIAQDTTYRPVNIPTHYQAVPLLTPPAAGLADDAEDDDGA